jgi:hypothetical protein
MDVNDALRAWLDGADPEWMAESVIQAGSERDTEIEGQFFERLAEALRALAEAE